MTVNEVEARTGLDRATVRYYESQGLLSPEREPNGYRSYSERDIDKLQKIKLLRALDFSLEDIRSMDADGADFADRLRARSRSLQAKSENIGDARRVIDMMLDDNARYESLESAAYLAALEERAPLLPETAPTAAPEPEPGPEPVSPWRRYFARWFDYLFCSLLVDWLWLAVLRISEVKILLSVLTLLAVILLEPVFLCTLGTTPGKFILGLRVRDSDGRRLSWRAALDRTCGVLFAGEALYIPILVIWRNWRSYKDANDGLTLSWEYEGRTEAKRDLDPRHAFAVIAAVAASIAAAVFIRSAPYMPKNRGDLTPAEYAENVNGEAGVYGWFLLEDGSWVERKQNNVIYVDGPDEGWEPESVELTVENGRVTGVRFHISGADETSLFDDAYRAYYICLLLTENLVGADRGAFLIYPSLNSFLEEISPGLERLESFTVTRSGWTVTADVNKDVSGDAAAFDLTLTVEKNG